MYLDLDNKVFGRDSILVADKSPPPFLLGDMGALDGWFKKLRGKVSKVLKKIPVVKSVYKGVKKFESKNRKGIKKIGGAIAVGTAAYFGGPYLLKAASAMGGSSLAKMAGSQLLQQQIGGVIQGQYTPQQIEQIQQYSAYQTPEQLMGNPYMQAMQQQVAQQMYPQNSPQQFLAQEGAFEVGHQIQKLPQANQSIGVKPPSFLTGETAKLLLPAALAIMTTLLINR